MAEGRTLILGIETSNPSAAVSASGVALGRMKPGGHGAQVEMLGSEVLRARSASDGSSRPARGGHDDDLLPAIQRLFEHANADRHLLARVAVSAGPGGYTGLRVACAAGAMIAEACGAACVSVPSVRVVLESVDAKLRSTGPVAIALASKGVSAWVQVFGWEQELGPGHLLYEDGVAALAEQGVRVLVADRFLPAPIRAAAERRAIAVIEPVFSAEACVRLGARLPVVEVDRLVPLYPREPDAVRLWREGEGLTGLASLKLRS